MATRFVIVQHAEKGSEPGDPGLTERGRAQADAIAESLEASKVDAIYASPLRRARETAEPIAERLGLTIFTDERLEERMNWDPSITLDEFLAEWNRATADRRYQPTIGQSSQVAGERLGAALSDLALVHPSQTVVVIGHGGITMDLARNLLGDAAVLKMVPHAVETGVPSGAVTEIVEEWGTLRVVALASCTLWGSTSDGSGSRHKRFGEGSWPEALWREVVGLVTPCAADPRPSRPDAYAGS